VLRALTAAAFGQRRKMLRSSLATLDLDALLPAAACVATSAPPQSVVGGSRQQRRQRRRLGKAGAVSLCDAAGIDAGKRDEAVSVYGFIKLVQTLIKTKTFMGQSIRLRTSCTTVDVANFGSVARVINI
jgi:16S rRNA A1518/A1519 N6-dimethyltransferase RsmA/KsgA/DIM1 with predicted DNA glycosylase/AP lyase activity